MEDLRLDTLMDKAGNAYRLVSLFQKRMRELERGWPPLVEPGGRELHKIVQEEFEKGLIHLATGEDADALREDHSLEEAELTRRRVVRERGSRLSGPDTEAPVKPPVAPAL